MGKVKPLPLFGEQPAAYEEAPQPRKSRGGKHEDAAPGDATQGAMNHAPAGDGLPLLLVRAAEGDATGLRRAADFVAAASERGWQPLVIASIGTLAGAMELYVAAQAADDGAKPLLGLTLPLRVGETVEVKGKREQIAATTLLLLARDERGWANLRQLADKGHALDLDSLNLCGAGLTVISLGWAAMALTGGKKEQLALNRALMVAKQACDGQLYLGVDAGEAQQAGRLDKQAAEIGLPLLALHCADFIDAGDAAAYAALCALHSLPTPDAPRPLLPADEARARFVALPGALEAASSLAATVKLTLTAAPLTPLNPELNPLDEPGSGAIASLQKRLAELPPPIGTAAKQELAAVDAAGLTFAYALAEQLAAYARVEGFAVRVGAGQGGDSMALAFGVGALPAELLPVQGKVSRSLCLEYPSGREQQLLEYVAKQYADRACLLLPPPRSGLRSALREAAKASNATADDLAHLLRRVSDEGVADFSDLSETQLALLTLAQSLAGRLRAGEGGSRSLLLTAQPAGETLPLEAASPLPTLRLSRAAVACLGGVRIDLSPSAALDLLDKVGGGAVDIALDDAATLALLQAGEADDIEGGGLLPPVGSVGELVTALAAQMAVGDNDANARCLAWDNYRLAYLKANQPQQYYAATTGPLGLHPLAAHAEHWRAATADGRLFSSATLPPTGSRGRALGMMRGLRRLVANDGNPLVAARLHDLAGELHIFAYPPTHTQLAAADGRLLLAYGTLLIAEGQAALLVEQISIYEGGAIGPLPVPSPSISQRERRSNVPGDIFDVIGELTTNTTKSEPVQVERTTTTTVNRANSNNGSSTRASGKEGAKQGGKPAAPPPTATAWVRRLHLRLPVSDDADADTERMHQIAEVARHNGGPDLLLLFIRSGNYEVRIEPRGFNVEADSFKREVSAALGHDPIFDEDQVEVAQG